MNCLGSLLFAQNQFTFLIGSMDRHLFSFNSQVNFFNGPQFSEKT